MIEPSGMRPICCAKEKGLPRGKPFLLHRTVKTYAWFAEPRTLMFFAL